MELKNILNKVMILLLAFLLVSASFVSFADDEIEYKTWTEVADGMAVHLDKAVELYVEGDADSAKAAKESVNVAYFKFYEKLGFEKTTMGAISGKRGRTVEYQFHTAKTKLKDGTKEEFAAEIEKLKGMLYEDAEFLDNRNKSDSTETDASANVGSVSDAANKIVSDASAALALLKEGKKEDAMKAYEVAMNSYGEMEASHKAVGEKLDALSAIIEEGTPEEMEVAVQELKKAVGSFEANAAPVEAESSVGASNGWMTFTAVFGLTMREGLEAILVIAAIVAYLLKTNNRKQLKTVYAGAILGIVFSILLAILFNYIAKVAGDAQSGFGQEVFEGMAMFLAVAVLFYVSNWMLSKSETEIWSNYIQEKVESSVSKGSAFALAFSAFLAVAREGAELILFFQGMRSNISNDPSQMWMGLALACVLLVVIYIAIAKYSVRLPLKPFFIATSALMFVMCISFLGKGVFELQEVDVIGRTMIPNFPDSEFLGWFGIYGRYENFVPQLILLVVTIISVVMHSKNNKKKRAALEMKNNK